MKNTSKMKNRVVAGLLAVVLAVLMDTPGLIVVAASAKTTSLVFPVNNGCKIAYYYGYTKEYGSTHNGIDIHAETGDQNIYAAANGTVVTVKNDCPHKGEGFKHKLSYGNYVKIKGKDGRFYYYGHLKQNSIIVKKNQKVVAGQKLAKMGNSGSSTGKHLHFEVRNTNDKTTLNVNPSAGNYKYKNKKKTFTYVNGPYNVTASSPTPSPSPKPDPSVTTPTPSPSPAPANEFPIENGKTYYIKAGVGSLYLSCKEKKNFGNISLSSKKEAASRWKAISTKNGWLFQNEYSKKVMDIYGTTPKAKANLQVYSKNNDDTQLFTLEESKWNNYFYIRNKSKKVYVDCYGNSGWKSGANVWTYSKTSAASASQVFRFIPV